MTGGNYTIPLIYITIGILWIVLSDMAALWISEHIYHNLLSFLNLAKGLFFVLCTGVVLFILMKKEHKKLSLQQARHKEREAVFGLQNEKLKAVSWLNSHEIRKPVASILALARLMQTSADEEEKSELLDLLHHCAVDLDDIILEINAEASGKVRVK
jgi:signal transduction histidine kinase